MAKDRVEIEILAQTKRALSGIQGLLGSFAKIGIAIAGFRGLQNVVNDSVEAYKKQITAETKLAAILKSTQGQLGLSQKELQDYAAEMQNLTGVGDEVIINAQAQMATFTKIGQDVFPGAIEAALNLSKAFDQDLKSSTIQIGKALQDPIQGVTALRRVGVQLSDQQTEAIRKFAELGDVAGAQKIILSELETQVGGVAKAYGGSIVGQMDVFKANMSDLSEGLGAAIMEGMAPYVELANKFFKQNKTKIVNILKNLPTLFMETMDLVSKIIKKGFSWEGFKKTIGALGMGFFETFKVVIQNIPEMFMATLKFLLAPVKNFGEWVGSIFEKIFADIGNFFIDALNVIPFVDIERMGTKTVQSFEDMGKETAQEMGEAFGRMKNVIVKNLMDIGSVWKDVGLELKEIYGEEIADYVDKIQQIIDAEEEKSEEVLNIAKELHEEIREIQDETTEEEIDNIEEVQKKYQELANTVTGIYGQLNSIVDQFYTNQEISLDNWYSNQQAYLESSIVNEEERAEALESLDEEYQRRRSALLTRQARMEKAAKVIKAIMDTASAVIEALPNIPLSILVGGLGLAQTAVITGQPIPTFATGGSFVTSGPQVFMAGDNPSGREEVTVTPLESSDRRVQYLIIDGKEFKGWLEDQIDRGLRTVRAS